MIILNYWTKYFCASSNIKPLNLIIVFLTPVTDPADTRRRFSIIIDVIHHCIICPLHADMGAPCMRLRQTYQLILIVHIAPVRNANFRTLSQCPVIFVCLRINSIYLNTESETSSNIQSPSSISVISFRFYLVSNSRYAHWDSLGETFSLGYWNA